MPGAANAEQFLWQTNSGGTDVHIFRLSDFALVERLEVGLHPNGIAAPDDASVVYIALEANGREHGELLWVDPDRLRVTHRLAVGLEPHAIATTPDGKWVYVPCRDGHYWVVDAEAKRVVKKIRTGGRPHNTQASRDSRYMYLSPMEKSEVTVVDVSAGHSVVGVIRFAGSVRPSALSADGRLLLQHVDALNGFQVADTVRREVIATVKHSSDLGGFIPIKRFGFLTLTGFKRCHGLAIRPDQKEVWSTCAEFLAVHRLAPPDFSEIRTIELPGKGYWLTFSPDSRHAFVALSGRDQVLVLDAATGATVQVLATGRAPKRNLVIGH